MRILYLKGDTPCYNYPKCIREGFSYYKFCNGWRTGGILQRRKNKDFGR